MPSSSVGFDQAEASPRTVHLLESEGRLPSFEVPGRPPTEQRYCMQVAALCPDRPAPSHPSLKPFSFQGALTRPTTASNHMDLSLGGEAREAKVPKHRRCSFNLAAGIWLSAANISSSFPGPSTQDFMTQHEDVRSGAAAMRRGTLSPSRSPSICWLTHLRWQKLATELLVLRELLFHLTPCVSSRSLAPSAQHLEQPPHPHPTIWRTTMPFPCTLVGVSPWRNERLS